MHAAATDKAARIDENGSREAFRETAEGDFPAAEYTAQDSRFIRSKLPVRHAVRIGASSMKVKPFRLMFTILLSFIAFTLFGLFSTLTFYDATATAVKTYLDSGYESLRLQKNYNYISVNYNDGEETDRWQSYRDTLFTPADLAAYAEKYGDGTIGLFNYSEYGDGNFTPKNVNAPADFNNEYYDYSLEGFGQIDASSATIAEKLLTDTDLSALGATIFVFGPLSWLVMLGIAVVTSFVATFLPVYSIAKRKPVESIRAL